MEKWLPNYKKRVDASRPERSFNQEHRLWELDIKRELELIKQQGYIPTMKPHDTGIGYTLETLLGLEETNKRGKADFCYKGLPTELKSQRKPTSSMLTLFTLEPPKHDYNDRKMISTYGYYSEEKQRDGLYATLTAGNYVPQGLKLGLRYDEGEVVIEDKDGNIPWVWSFDELATKIGNIVFAFANKTGSKISERFHYNEAYYLTGLKRDMLFDLFKENKFVVDLRMHIKPENKVVRNHGTGFRIRDLRKNLFQCYETLERLI
jgi:hypothetical protein